MTICGKMDKYLVFIDTNFRSTVTKMGLIYFGFGSTGIILGFFYTG